MILPFLSFPLPRHPLFPIIPAYNPAAAAAAAAAAASFQSLLSSAGMNQRPAISGGAPEYHSLLTSLAISATTTDASGTTSHTASPSAGSPPSPPPTLAQKVGEEGNTKNEQETKGAEEMEVDSKSATEAEGSLSAKNS